MIALSDVVNGRRNSLQTIVDLDYEDLQLTRPKLFGKVDILLSFTDTDQLRKQARLNKRLDNPGLLRVRVVRASNLRNVELAGQTQVKEVNQSHLPFSPFQDLCSL